MNKKKSIILLIAGLAIFVIWCLAQLEAYIPMIPDIDTTFSAGYSEEKFDAVEIGYSRAEVVALLGEPLYTMESKQGTSAMRYSSDGKCFWGDFAWIGRSIIIKDGIVQEKKKEIFYD